MPKEKEKKAKPTNIRSVVLPDDLSKKLGELAEAEQRSISFMIVRAIREMIERAEAEGKGK